MNLNQLYYFRTLAEYQHYTRAAEKLYISQPSLSNAMKSLEKELGCVLFKKSGRNIQLTEYGRMFYNTVCSALNTIDEGKRDIEQKIKSDSGIINIACIPTAVGTRLPSLVRDFQIDNNSSPYFIIHDKFSHPILDGLTNGDYDIGICSRDSDYQDIAFIPFFTEKIVVIVPENHPLAQYEQIEPKMLRSYDIVTYSKETPIGMSVYKELNAKCPNLKIVRALDGEVAIAGQVTTNDVVGIAAETVLLNAFDLKKISLNISQDTRMVYIAYNKTRQLSPETQQFIDYLKENKTIYS